MMKYLFKILLISSCLFTAACTSNSKNKFTEANIVAENNGFIKKLVQGDQFLLTTYQKIADQNQPYVFYIESDGHAFMSYGVSDDPTPYHPLLLKLAAVDPRPNVVYIARPCQYTPMNLNPKCTESTIFWTTKRLSEEVVTSINQVIKTINNGKPFSLVGYSGGGGVAVLVAARNRHVKDIITLAGNLDIISFSDFHSPTSDPQKRQLVDSLNPIDYATKINQIPQLHIAGGRDKKVPPFISSKYIHASNSTCVHQKIFANATHSEGWQAAWLSILNIPLICE